MTVDFKQCFVHFGLPCYGGQLTEPFFTSFVRFVLAAERVGLKWAMDTQPNDSLVTRARNNLMAKMLANAHATHFMFIDADIRFEPEGILNMLVADKDVIGGLYPLKRLPITYVVNARADGQAQGDLHEVDTIGTGFLLMKRNAIERMIAAYPETKYVDDTDFGKQFEPHMYALFDCEIDERGHYLSEDWTFCRRWSRLGGKIFAHMKVLLNHVGRYEYAGDLRKLQPR
jgi:hypothetical protein